MTVEFWDTVFCIQMCARHGEEIGVCETHTANASSFSRSSVNGAPCAFRNERSFLVGKCGVIKRAVKPLFYGAVIIYLSDVNVVKVLIAIEH